MPKMIKEVGKDLCNPPTCISTGRIYGGGHCHELPASVCSKYYGLRMEIYGQHPYSECALSLGKCTNGPSCSLNIVNVDKPHVPELCPLKKIDFCESLQVNECALYYARYCIINGRLTQPRQFCQPFSVNCAVNKEFNRCMPYKNCNTVNRVGL